jgi:transcription elongation factor Elf1
MDVPEMLATFNDDKLNTCIFCSGQAIVDCVPDGYVDNNNVWHYTFFVRCLSCGLQGPKIVSSSTFKNAIESAVYDWNSLI